MAVISNLVAKLRADTSVFERKMRGARNSSRSFTRQMHAMNRSLANLSRSVLAFAGFTSFTVGLRRVTAAAITQQKAEADLAAALRLTSTAWQQQQQELTQYAAQLQRVTVYGDEQIIAQIAYAKNLGVATGQLKEAAKAAIGLAAKYSIDLKSAMMLVGRASQGQTSMLTRYGIVLDKTLSPQDQFNQLLTIGADAFQLARAQAETAEGALKQFKNAVGDLAEEIGEKLLPALTGAAKGWTEFLQIGAKKSAAAVLLQSYKDSLTAIQQRIDSGESSGELLAMALKRRNAQFNAMRKKAEELGAPIVMGEGTTVADLIRSWSKPPKVDAITGGALPATALSAQSKRENKSLAAGTDGASKPTSSKPSQAVFNVESALARMASQMQRVNAANARAQQQILDKQLEEYKEHIDDKVLLDQWYTEQVQQLDIKRLQASQNMFDGFKAAAMQMKRDARTWGEIGFDTAMTMEQGFATAFENIANRTATVTDALKTMARETLQEFARLAIYQPAGKALAGFTSNALGNIGASFFSGGVPGFAAGGISNRPAIFGESGPEAAVPLPDGRSIPVDLRGQAGNVTSIVINNRNEGDPIQFDVQSMIMENNILTIDTFTQRMREGGDLTRSVRDAVSP